MTVLFFFCIENAMFSLVKRNLLKSYAVLKSKNKGRNAWHSFHIAYTYNLINFWKTILDLIVNLIEKSLFEWHRKKYVYVKAM